MTLAALVNRGVGWLGFSPLERLSMNFYTSWAFKLTSTQNCFLNFLRNLSLQPSSK